jgi:ditrans,polycis-polyprenyl diphosphate synthase
MFNYWISFKSFLVSLLLEALKRFGPIPQHVAIIMDGNRRFAKKHRLERASAGHFEGAKTLERVKADSNTCMCVCTF